MHKLIMTGRKPILLICNEDFKTGYQAGIAFIQEGQEVEVMDSERLIANLKSLAQEGAFDGTQDDLMQWHVGLLIGMIAGSPQA